MKKNGFAPAVAKLLAPADSFMQMLRKFLKEKGYYDTVQENSYRLLKAGLRAFFSLYNGLKIYGPEHIPETGGVIIAANHKSLIDPLVIVAAVPRKVSLVLPTKVHHQPIVSQLSDLLDCVYVNKDDFDGSIEELKIKLADGHCLLMFPEGSFPGDLRSPHWEVNPQTGMLPGKIGVAKLAVESGCPVVPTAIVGTQAVLGPEALPKFEKLPLPRPSKIEVRFGEPIWFYKRKTEPVDYEQLRGMTDRLIKSIALLMDQKEESEVSQHEEQRIAVKFAYKNKPFNARQKYGVLVLHGFTSHIDCVAGLKPILDELALPYRFPILRGHGTHWHDLRGVKRTDWFNDASAAFKDLLDESYKVVVVGLSMGGLLALDLAAHFRDQTAGVVAIAPALRFKNPLVKLSPLLAKIFPSWPSPNSFADPELKAQRNKNYPKFPTDAFLELYRYSQEVEKRLSYVTAPLLLIMTKQDQIVHPKTAEIIMYKVSSKDKKLVWFEKSGHEMLLDLEADKVTQVVKDYLVELIHHKRPKE